MPDDRRIKRIEAFMLQELARIVSRELKDPVFDNKVISFPDIKVSKDLSIALVSVSVFGKNANPDEVVVKLNSITGIIRKLIMDVCDLRKVPVFTFHLDRTIERASKIDSILNSLVIPPAEPEDSTE
ncbi:MAG: 30S ribosome-binding factor RbfA [bacterium]